MDTWFRKIIEFVVYYNSRVEGLKFTYNYSHKEISFLHTVVSLNPDRSINTSVYRKPNAGFILLWTHQIQCFSILFLNQKIENSIPKSTFDIHIVNIVH